MSETSDPVFRAIAHPARREIIRFLAIGEMPVGDIAARFEMTRPAVAKHLGILQGAGLVQTRKQGRETLNRLEAAPLKAVSDWLQIYSQFWDTKLQNLKRAVEDDHD